MKRDIPHRPFLVTIISFVMCWNFLHSSTSSSVTLSSLSVGSPFSRPACSSLSTALSSRDMQGSAELGLRTLVMLAWLSSAEDTEPDSPSSCKPSTFIWTHRENHLCLNIWSLWMIYEHHKQLPFEIVIMKHLEEIGVH